VEVMPAKKAAVKVLKKLERKIGRSVENV